ncbi:biotin/lipoyl-containing protein [Sporosalibacterium faouarense]|uniref:biotin/lipoyl-containing protein n=1 Tax=Sporosalibacterium faouarense TaxID=516123 RepID=UPI00192C8C4E|nr:biotin/lipoyl-containing protein [Sporosalibacterium faouarense]
MKKYKITVNGKAYEVEVEDLGGSGVSAPAQVTTQSTPVAKPASKPATPAPKAASKPEPKKAEAPKAVPQGAETVEAPMPGTILDIKVSEGDSVTEGQVLVILEAMKMENEIVAPRAGKVAAINVTNGASVNAGDTLVSLG